MPNITCTEAQNKLAKITRLKDEFLRVLEHASHGNTPFTEAKHLATQAIELKALLTAEMNTFARELNPNYPITIDYSLGLDQMIERGNYEDTDSDIIKFFFIEGEGKINVDLEIIAFDKNLTTAEILTGLEAQGLVPARLEHLLAFGAAYPEEQLEVHLIALGSSWVDSGGDRSVPYLGWNGHGRFLSLRWGYPGDQWNNGFSRFLAVSK